VRVSNLVDDLVYLLDYFVEYLVVLDASLCSMFSRRVCSRIAASAVYFEASKSEG